jgi:hypothetical protein
MTDRGAELYMGTPRGLCRAWIEGFKKRRKKELSNHRD